METTGDDKDLASIGFPAFQIIRPSKKEQYDENRSLNPVLRGHKCSVIGCDFRTTNLDPLLMDHVINPPDKCRQLRQLQFGPVPSVARPGIPILPFWSFENLLSQNSQPSMSNASF